MELNQNQADPYVLLAFTMLLQYDKNNNNLLDCIKKAKIKLQNALNIDPNCILALLGKAICLYHEKSYKLSCVHYCQILELYDGNTLSFYSLLYLGIGLCHFQLKDYIHAKLSFKKVINDNNANNSIKVEAYYALALIESITYYDDDDDDDDLSSKNVSKS